MSNELMCSLSTHGPPQPSELTRVAKCAMVRLHHRGLEVRFRRQANPGDTMGVPDLEGNIGDAQPG